MLLSRSAPSEKRSVPFSFYGAECLAKFHSQLFWNLPWYASTASKHFIQATGDTKRWQRF